VNAMQLIVVQIIIMIGISSKGMLWEFNNAVHDKKCSKGWLGKVFCKGVAGMTT
jgi:hypothetical protein